MSSTVVAAALRSTPLSVAGLLEAVTGPEVGGVGLFVGVVRDRDGGRDVTSLDYEAHPSADAELRRVAEQVAAAYEVISVAVEHRTGHLEVGDLAVVIAVGAVHRQPALAGCAALIELVKHEVPIWKQQHYASGGVGWIGLPGAESEPAR